MPEVNNGNGLFDTQGMFKETLAMIDVLADAKGVFRAKSISCLYDMVKALKDGVQKEIAGKDAKIEELKAQLEIIQKGVE